MSKELNYLIEQLCRDKGISKDVILNTLEAAMRSAVRKKFSEDENIDLRIDPKNCDVSVFRIKNVVNEVKDDRNEISLTEAQNYDSNASIGNSVEIPIDIKDFGRIAAQTAKQVLFQKVREAERGVIYNEFSGKVNTVTSGMVLRKERGAYYVSIGKAEALLPIKETIYGENLKSGDTVRAYIDAVSNTARGPQIRLTRTNTQFVLELFKMEVPEINEGIVEIKGAAREAGERTKISVVTNDPAVDPVGACVGMKGTRVQSIVRELKGERIDIMHWSEDPRQYISTALTPAAVDRVGINEEDKVAMVVVEDKQLSIAIGKKGVNVRLAMKLTGWDIDIISESKYEEIKQEGGEEYFEGTGDEEIDEQASELSDSNEEIIEETGGERQREGF